MSNTKSEFTPEAKNDLREMLGIGDSSGDNGDTYRKVVAKKWQATDSYTFTPNSSYMFQIHRESISGLKPNATYMSIIVPYATVVDIITTISSNAGIWNMTANDNGIINQEDVYINAYNTSSENKTAIAHVVQLLVEIE